METMPKKEKFQQQLRDLKTLQWSTPPSCTLLMDGKSWQERIQRRQMREAMKERADQGKDTPGIFDVPDPFAVPSIGVAAFIQESGRAAELEQDEDGPEHER